MSEILPPAAAAVVVCCRSIVPASRRFDMITAKQGREMRQRVASVANAFAYAPLPRHPVLRESLDIVRRWSAGQPVGDMLADQEEAAQNAAAEFGPFIHDVTGPRATEWAICNLCEVAADIVQAEELAGDLADFRCEVTLDFAEWLLRRSILAVPA
jgi:hypothetical protein